MCHDCGTKPAKISVNIITDGVQVYKALCQDCYVKLQLENKPTLESLKQDIQSLAEQIIKLADKLGEL